MHDAGAPNRRRNVAAAAAAGALVSALMISACENGIGHATGTFPVGSGSAAGAAASGVSNNTATSTGDSATRFTACLTAGGIQTQTHPLGFIGIRDDAAASDLAAQSENTVTMSDATDPTAPLYTWVDEQGFGWAAPASAEYFTSDFDAAETWAACETQVPEFHQITWTEIADRMSATDDGVASHEAALRFAAAARAAGDSWVAEIILPSSIQFDFKFAA